MVVSVDEIVTDSLSACIGAWFEVSFTHDFLALKTISVPDDEKPIPRRWLEEVEIGMDEGFAGEEADVLGEGPTVSWTLEEARQRLRDALGRLGLREGQVCHPELHRMSREDVANEKRRVKQELKRYDSEFRRTFRRLPAHNEKEPMRPLYVYYRRLKTLLTQMEQSRGSRRSSGTVGDDDDDDEGDSGRLRLGPRDEFEGGSQQRGETSIKDQIVALEARLESLQNEKAEVRAKLQTFQEKFVVENNRKIRFHKDILPIERQFRVYKSLKEEITKQEALLRELKEQA